MTYPANGLRFFTKSTLGDLAKEMKLVEEFFANSNEFGSPQFGMDDKTNEYKQYGFVLATDLISKLKYDRYMVEYCEVTIYFM